MHKNLEKQVSVKTMAISEERFRALVTTTSDVIYSLSPDWSVMYPLDGRGFLVDAHEATTGWKAQNVYPADMDKVNAAIEEAIRTKKIFELEHRVNRADGSLGWTFSRAVPILDDQGEIVEWFGTASDITDQKTAEVALQQVKEDSEKQHRLLEAITSGTPDLIYVFDLNYRFTYANSALLAMWGKTWESAIGRSLLENGYEQWHADMHEREIDQVRETKQAVRGEVSFPHATLGKRVYDYILIPVLNDHGDVEAVAGTTRDITERKEDEQRKNDFIGMVSHELKTPLTSLNAIIQVAKAKMETCDDKFLSSAMFKAQLQVRRMSTMINGFLNISRLESGKLSIDKQLFDIEKLIREVAEEIELTVSTHTLCVSACESAEVYADRDKINSVISNLISNSVKYSYPNTTISISCKYTDGEVEVSVRDEGIGISPSDISNIFERYYRIESSNTRHIAGFGIGLYLSAEIVERHGGKIRAESVPGKGSTFYFSLPASRIKGLGLS